MMSKEIVELGKHWASVYLHVARHCECLAGANLAIRHYSGVVAFEEIVHTPLGASLVHLLLVCRLKNSHMETAIRTSCKSFQRLRWKTGHATCAILT